jgi:hypothetical protein
MLQSATCGAGRLPSLFRGGSTCRQLCVQCAVTDENQSLVRDLGHRLGYLSVTASGLFLNRGNHSTAKIIRRNIFCWVSATSKYHGLSWARMSCCAGRHIWTHAWSCSDFGSSINLSWLNIVGHVSTYIRPSSGFNVNVRRLSFTSQCRYCAVEFVVLVLAFLVFVIDGII